MSHFGRVIPRFEGEPFVFPEMGRSQDCRNSIFTEPPEIVTSNLDEALEHFRKTDFSEFGDIVEKYASTMDFVHPDFENGPRGKSRRGYY